ncbi:unnamed protein product [Candida verbasci]|uniref:Vam7p n=1 Tax=Candida verbasci TaxID=1227364 RepID=A0A9W4U2I1_9ASCO|nr:unnamed protein product [Candida verbasci]
MSIEILSEENSYYKVNIHIPLRSYIIKKRYSDFETLVNNLCYDLGIDVKEFPHQLPGKRLNFINKNKIIEERKVELTKFLNNLIQDKELQNHLLVKEFLQLPNNFQFKTDSWYPKFKKLKIELTNETSKGLTLREKINKFYQPQLIELLCDDDKEKKKLLQQLQNKLDDLIKPEIQLKPSGRVIGKETELTIPLTNTELLQEQINIHQSQDQEVEQLRVLISRQRQIAELINTEVEEQNVLLDQFNEEVDQTSDKVKKARTRARKIL